MKFLDPKREWRDDDQEVIAFHRRFKRSRKLQMALGMNVGGSNPTLWLTRVLDRLGLKTKGKQFREDDGSGDHHRKYWIDPNTWNDPYRTSICATFPERWKQYLGEEYSLPQFDLQTPEPEQDVAVTDLPSKLIEQRGVVTTKEQEQVTKAHVEEIQEISNWLLTSYSNSLESLEPLLETARTVLEGMPGMIRQILWQGLPAGLKNAILRDYREHFAFFTA